MSQVYKSIQASPPPPGFVETLTGNSGGAVGPNASDNINVVGDGTTINAVGNPGTNTITFSLLALNTYHQTAINYQVLVTDYIIGVNGNAGAITITMPNSGMRTAQQWIIKDESGTGFTRNITVSGNGALIDGSSTYVMNQNYSSITLYFNGTNFYVA